MAQADILFFLMEILWEIYNTTFGIDLPVKRKGKEKGGERGTEKGKKKKRKENRFKDGQDCRANYPSAGNTGDGKTLNNTRGHIQPNAEC